nr:MAG TPA: hypothetical protein [Caudoviricetes sp.]
MQYITGNYQYFTNLQTITLPMVLNTIYRSPSEPYAYNKSAQPVI